jgi:katanin p60 ATPase-containing subunit A1
MLRMYMPEDTTENIEYAQAAARCEGYSGSDMKLLCKESAMKPLRRLLYQLENIECKEVNSRKRLIIQKDK